MGFIAIVFLGSTSAMLITMGWEAIRHRSDLPSVSRLGRRFTRGWNALGRRVA
jgi:hypothetical protein